jgi:beta-lactamase superfamily II metal-dependent hydrolase
LGKAVISATLNKEILDRLEQAGVNVYRTDLNGTIIAESDGEKVTVKSK